MAAKCTFMLVPISALSMFLLLPQYFAYGNPFYLITVRLHLQHFSFAQQEADFIQILKFLCLYNLTIMNNF